MYMTLEELETFQRKFQITLLHLGNLIDRLYEWDDNRHL